MKFLFFSEQPIWLLHTQPIFTRVCVGRTRWASRPYQVHIAVDIYDDTIKIQYVYQANSINNFRLILCRNCICIFCKDHTGHISAQCGQILRLWFFLNGTYSNFTNWLFVINNTKIKGSVLGLRNIPLQSISRVLNYMESEIPLDGRCV
jgi:hypothetical protein